MLCMYACRDPMGRPLDFGSLPLGDTAGGGTAGVPADGPVDGCLTFDQVHQVCCSSS